MNFQQNLLAGEKILWQGVPGRGIRFRRMDFYLIPFGLFFFGFSLFWEWLATSGKSPGIFPIFGIPFILVGLYLVIGRFFWDAYSRARSAYTLTNQRAIIQTMVFGSTLKSMTLADLPEVGLEERSDGSGTVILGRDTQIGFGENRYSKPTPRFEFIPDAKRVYRLIEEARNNGKK